VEYTVAIRIRVAGGARRGTAERRAGKVAVRLADAAARIPDVVEVTATAGPSHDGKVTWPTAVSFAAANTDPAPLAADRLLRYLDPDHAEALRSLAEHNAAARERRRADVARRTEVGCANTVALLEGTRVCGCVYCDTVGHDDAAQDAQRNPDCRYVEHRCVCGQPVADAGGRCLRHRNAAITVLPGDGAELRRLADADPRTANRHEPVDAPAD
jgi:hypothetical protein